MLPISDKEKRYKPAHKRFPKAALENYFATEFPKVFGPRIRSVVVDQLIEIFNSNNRDIKTLKPGQVLWNAIHKDTRADSKKMKLVPVVLTLINQDDISELEKGLKIPEHKQNVIARILTEAYNQNALLSMRDVSLLLAISDSNASTIRKKYENKHNTQLPHPGTLHDMGSCITHKYQIIYKCVVQKKDPLIVARETNHTMQAVDHYLNDYNRVKILYMDNKEIDYIQLVTKMSKALILQYVNIIETYVIQQNKAI